MIIHDDLETNPEKVYKIAAKVAIELALKAGKPLLAYALYTEYMLEKSNMEYQREVIHSEDM